MKVGWNDDEYSYVERVYVLSIVGTIPQINQIVYHQLFDRFHVAYHTNK